MIWLRYLASRPTACLFWLSVAVGDVGYGIAPFWAAVTRWIRGRS